MFTEIPGEHCERCLLASPQEDWHANLCRRFHGAEYLCPACATYVDDNIPKLTAYLKDYGGCLFQELRFAEERLNIKIVR